MMLLVFVKCLQPQTQKKILSNFTLQFLKINDAEKNLKPTDDYLLKNRLQISLLMISEFKLINFYSPWIIKKR